MNQVSVIVPCRNAERFLETALKSVLCQPQLLEVVLVDDGSTDDSVGIATRLGDSRLRVVPGPCQGIAAAFNAGLAAARGQIIVRCDADDALPPDRLSWQVQWLRDHPDFIAVCGSFMTIDSTNDELAHFEFARQEEDITAELRNGRARTHFCTFACRAEALRAVGGCRPWFRTAEDIDLQFRLAGTGRIGFVPRLAYRYRIHDGSITHQQFDEERDFYWSTAQEFARQRQAKGADGLQAGQPPPLPTTTGRRLQADEHAQGLLLGHAWRENDAGRRLHSVWIGARALAAAPSNLRAWRSMGALVYRSINRWSPRNPRNPRTSRPATANGRAH